MEKKNEIIINGFGSTNGGVFSKAVINGTGTVNGNLECDTFECNGMGTVDGDVQTKRIRISGTAKVNGMLATAEGRVDGQLSILDDALVQQLKVAGMFKAGGMLRGEVLNVHGGVTVGGDCELEEYKVDGKFHIAGLLNAERIEAFLHGECEAKEIGGQTIRIRKRKASLFNPLQLFITPRLTTESVEGDDVELECTTAKVVRGKNVNIGSDCEIDLVEFTGTYAEHKSAKVKESRRV